MYAGAQHGDLVDYEHVSKWAGAEEGEAEMDSGAVFGCICIYIEGSTPRFLTQLIFNSI